MKFTIITPQSSRTLEINWLEVETAQGSFTVQEGHAPLIAPLSANKEISIHLKDGSITTMTLAGGILEVTRDSVIVLTYS